jgi:HEPN domain-containing protein
MREGPRYEGKRWLEQALTDLEWAHRLHEQGAYYLVCFLSQQAAEKALKAFLYAQGEELVIGHSVRQLCGGAAGYDETFQQQQDEWGVLDSYYIPTRYPNGLPDDIPARIYNHQAGEGALSLADRVIEKVKAWFMTLPD